MTNTKIAPTEKFLDAKGKYIAAASADHSVTWEHGDEEGEMFTSCGKFIARFQISKGLDCEIQHRK
jgi:hypothetical protein